MNKTTIPIKGMHCRSCELLIEEELKTVSGVKKVQVSWKRACADVYYEGEEVNNNEIMRVIEQAGYKIGIEEKKPLFSKNLEDYVEVAVASVALFFLYIFLNIFGLNQFFNVSTASPTGLIPIFLIGLTAGFSTCMALIGGLILGVSARFSEKHPDAKTLIKFKPHIYFNTGRIVSYVFLGGVIGTIGSLFQLSSFSLGLMTLGVALVMLTLGLQLTGLFPRISSAGFTIPNGISRLLGINKHQKNTYSHRNSFTLGALTFFLPCGFTQAMQLLAISSGSFWKGATIMGIFALGTAPGLLGIGGITSILKGFFAQKFFRFAGVVVAVLALYNMQNGLNLMGLPTIFPLSSGSNALALSNTPNIVNGSQIIKMTQSGNGYSPNVLTVVKGIPVKWIITSVNPNSCASSIIAQKLNIRKNLVLGENVIEFTPTNTGKIPFSCSMGMYTGVINVVEKGSQVSTLPQNNIVQAQVVNTGGSCGMGGGCGCGRRNQALAQ